MATSNINFIITAPTNGYIITSDNVTAPSEYVSQYEVNKLNFSLVGFTSPSAVKLSITLPDGTIYPTIEMVPSGNGIFTRDLTGDAFTNITVGDLNLMTINSIEIIANSGYKYYTESTTTFSIGYYKTNTDVSYVPDDIENLYIGYHDLVDKYRKLTGEDFDFDDYVTKDSLSETLQDYATSSDIAKFAAVATTGSYNDLLDTPTIPTKVSQLTNDSGFITANSISNKIETSDLKTINGLSLYKRAGESNNIIISTGSGSLPDAPTDDGTYVLKCTVSSGSVVYSWVKEE